MRLEDLKRGMKCTFRNGTNKIIDTVFIEPNRVECLPNKQGHKATYFSFNEDLISKADSELDIMKIEDITENGYETIWEREEPKYYLRLPNHDKAASLNYLNVDRTSGLFYIDNNVTCITLKTQFTEEEIDKLPNQDFIKSLVKEEV